MPTGMIWTGEPLDVPEMSLATLLLERCAHFADRPAFIDSHTGAVTSFTQLAELTTNVTQSLQDRGTNSGDVIATILPNSTTLAVLILGIAAHSATLTPLNPRLTRSEMMKHFEATGARQIVTSPELVTDVRESLKGQHNIEVVSSEEVTAPGPNSAPTIPAGPDDVAALMMSSGTTGIPKAVMQTHRNLVAQILSMQVAENLTEDVVTVAVFPFFHTGGLSLMLSMLYAGASQILLPAYDLRGLLSAIETYGVNHLTVPPPVVVDLAQSGYVDDFDLSSLCLIRWGAAPLPEPVAMSCSNRLGCAVLPGYAMSETASRTHTARIDLPRPPGSSGVPNPGVACKVTDIDTGNSLGPNEIGEICIHGPMVMPGYLNAADATAKAIDADGWLHSGDLGFVDESGWLTIVDRLKDVMKVNGYQVTPTELEAVLLTHPMVADVAVVPLPDERSGQIPKAFVVTRGQVSEAELSAHLAANVAPYKRIRTFEFVSEFPAPPPEKCCVACWLIELRWLPFHLSLRKLLQRESCSHLDQ